MVSRRAILRVLHVAAAPLVLVALWVPGCNQGDFRTDTGLYAAISKLMYAEAVRTGSLAPLWWPMLGDAPYFNKPPLVFWAHGLLIHLFGTELWAVRLPTLAAGVIGVMALQRAASRLGGRAAGMMSGLVLATTLEFFRYTRAVSLDVWLVAFMLMGLSSAAGAVKRGSPRGLLTMGVCVGLGLMVKPLYALALPVVVGVWLAWTLRRRGEMGRQEPGATAPAAAWSGALALSILVAIAVAAPWYISMWTRWGDAFLHEHFVRQSLERAIQAPQRDPGRSWTWSLAYLPREFASTYWPWLVTLALAAAALARKGVIGRSRALDRLGIVWSLLFALGLMAFAGKRSRYMVPLYPGLALLSGAWLSVHPPTMWRRHLRRAMVLWAPVLPVAALVGSVALARVGISAHEAPSGAIERLQAALQQAGNPATWVAPAARLNAARLYAKGSPWPMDLGWAASRSEPGSTRLPRAGDVVLYSSEDGAETHGLNAASDTVLASEAGMTAVRVGRDWTADDAARFRGGR